MVSFKIFLLVLASAVGIVWLMRRFHLPPILGYLFAGILVGPYGLGFLEDQHELSFIAEFGVVFLLFTIGLELSFPKLFGMRRALLGLGGMQVLLCTLIVLGVARFFDVEWPAAIAIAGALTLSSTAVATKQLIEQNELYQAHGKIALSILLFQDLAAVPFLILVPAFGGAEEFHFDETFFNALFMGIIVFLGMLAAGRWFLRPLFHHVAHVKSTELFMLTGILVVLVSAFLTEEVGLSLALGGFLAGVMLAETEYVHQIESDILPFRDILLGLFFITVGMKLDPHVIVDQWQWVSIIVLSIIAAKTLIIAVLGKLTGATAQTSLRSGLTLAQGGEFGFALLALAGSNQLLSVELNQMVTASIIITLAIAPLLIRKNDQIAQAILPTSELPKEDTNLPTSTEHQANHVIICGYGRVGQTLARFLEYEGIPFIGLDMDALRLKQARAAGEPVYYGDSADETVLRAAGTPSAKLLIIAYDDDSHSKKCLNAVRRINKNIPVLVRTADDRHLEQLQTAGATEIISDKLESSLMLASHMLMLLGTAPDVARQQVWEVKTNRYKMLQAYYASEEDHQHLEEKDKEQLNLHAVELTSEAYAVGKTLDAFMTEKMPIQIAQFSRKGIKTYNPDPNTELKANDVIVVMGTSEEVYLAEEKLLKG